MSRSSMGGNVLNENVFPSLIFRFGKHACHYALQCLFQPTVNPNDCIQQLSIEMGFFQWHSIPWKKELFRISTIAVFTLAERERGRETAKKREKKHDSELRPKRTSNIITPAWNEWRTQASRAQMATGNRGESRTLGLSNYNLSAIWGFFRSTLFLFIHFPAYVCV